MQIALQIIFGSYCGWMLTPNLKDKPHYIVLGILGSIAASWLMAEASLMGNTTYDLYSFTVSLTGALLIIFAGKRLYTLFWRFGFLTERRLVPR